MPEPIQDFFEVSFDSREQAAQFAFQVLNLAQSDRGTQLSTGTQRLVAFQPLISGKTSKAYVSAGAARMLTQVGSPFPISNTPTALRDLPSGLALVVGDQRDVTEYENSKRA